MYSVIELEIAAALRRAAATGLAPRDSVPLRQFYPDRQVGPSFTLHRGFVIPHAGGKVELRHDWLAGTGDVTVDSSGRMLTYSGKRSTYQVAVARTTTLHDVESIGVVSRPRNDAPGSSSSACGIPHVPPSAPPPSRWITVVPSRAGARSWVT